jgi:multidrug efflux pump subunit AcrA (membrane-fusion protein)
MATRKMTKFLSLFLALALAGMAACSKPEKEADPVVNVQVAQVKQAEIENRITSEAVLFPLQQAAITPKISAPVKRFYVNRGSRVKAGQLLATLEDRDLAASEVENKGTLSQAEATYATATASALPEEFRKAELDVEATRQAFEAEQKLYESRQNLYQQGALPRKDLDQARVSFTQAKSQYEIAQRHWNALQAGGKEQELKSATGQLQSARGKYEGSRAQLSYSEIRSPINGFITDRALYAGEMASAGTPLLVVMDTSSVIAKAHIPQKDAVVLKVGDHAELTVQDSDDKIPARITVVSPATDPNSTTIEIWALAANPSNHLHPGTTVQLTVTSQKVNNAILVPASAVLNQPEGGTAVMIVGADSRAHVQPVQVGIENAGQVQIASGLKGNEQVIVNGAYGLPDNTQVKIESPSELDKPESDKPDAEKPAAGKPGAAKTTSD